MSNYTDQEKADCAAREYDMRRRVYYGLVQRNKMTQEEADLEIDKMREIAEDYARKASGQVELFT